MNVFVKNLAESGRIWHDLEIQRFENPKNHTFRYLKRHMFIWQNLAESGRIWR